MNQIDANYPNEFATIDQYISPRASRQYGQHLADYELIELDLKETFDRIDWTMSSEKNLDDYIKWSSLIHLAYGKEETIVSRNAVVCGASFACYVLGRVLPEEPRFTSKYFYSLLGIYNHITAPDVIAKTVEHSKNINYPFLKMLAGKYILKLSLDERNLAEASFWLAANSIEHERLLRVDKSTEGLAETALLNSWYHASEE